MMAYCGNNKPPTHPQQATHPPTHLSTYPSTHPPTLFPTFLFFLARNNRYRFAQLGDVKGKIYTHCGTNPGMQKLSLRSGGQTVSRSSLLSEHDKGGDSQRTEERDFS